MRIVMCVLVLFFVAGCISSTKTYQNDPALEQRIDILEEQIQDLQRQINDFNKQIPVQQ